MTRIPGPPPCYLPANQRRAALPADPSQLLPIKSLPWNSLGSLGLEHKPLFLFGPAT